jgi:DNA-binding transcriptional ArsR family regulator
MARRHRSVIPPSATHSRPKGAQPGIQLLQAWHRTPELSTRADSELRVHLAQVVFDRSGADEKLAGYLRVGGDSHRRTILDRLGAGPVSISELAVPLGMSLPGVLKHVRALEAAQLVVTRKEGRTRWCRLGERPLDDAAAWIDERRTLWATRLDRFGASLEDAGR